jgi:hypothetical protein
VIEDLRDVSAAMNKGVTAKLSGLQRFEKMDQNRKALIAACEKQPSRRCDVRAYYGGAQYWLQQQLEIKDVRLVYAPAGGIGNFGGETDNWMWPRHTGDFGFYRAYVAPDGSSAPFAKEKVPYRPKAHPQDRANGCQGRRLRDGRRLSGHDQPSGHRCRSQVQLRDDASRPAEAAQRLFRADQKPDGRQS